MDLIHKRQMYAHLLYFVRIVKTTEHKRSSLDARVYVDETVVEYRDASGDEYRKSFETRPGVQVSIPRQGTHKQLNDERKQW